MVETVTIPYLNKVDEILCSVMIMPIKAILIAESITKVPYKKMTCKFIKGPVNELNMKLNWGGKWTHKEMEDRQMALSILFDSLPF